MSVTGRARVRINYKSGISMEIECDNFGVKRLSGRDLSITWENAVPRPLLIGVDDIESVWEVHR